MDRVYLDTSFFIALIENQEGRREEAKSILEYEKKSEIFTSVLTIQEFLVRVFDRFMDDISCEERLKSAANQIRAVARAYAMPDGVLERAARIQSLYGKQHGQASPREPRDRKFRWNALHLATASELRCQRLYAWNGKWEDLPEDITRMVGRIISPAVCPALRLELETRPTTAEPSNAPAQPAEQSPSVSPPTAAEPEQSLPSDRPADQEELPPP